MSSGPQYSGPAASAYRPLAPKSHSSESWRLPAKFIGGVALVGIIVLIILSLDSRGMFGGSSMACIRYHSSHLLHYSRLVVNILHALQ